MLIVSSIFIITKFDKTGEKLKLNKGHLYSLISATCFGIAFANDSFIAAQLGVIQCLLIIFFVPGLFVLLLKPNATKKMATLLTKANLIKMFSFSLLYLLGAITIFAAYTAGGDAGKIYRISNSSVILTVILAAVFLGEKDQPMRKIAATATAFLGILMLR
jgi:drug/metabolite transporter (DMT)-like permease